MSPKLDTLAVQNLHVSFRRKGVLARAVRGLDLEIGAGEIHGLVGESGSGKSVTALAIMGLLPARTATITADALRTGETDLLGLDEERYRRIRGGEISMIFQEPGKHLNPALRIGTQISDVIRAHEGVSASRAKKRAANLVDLVGLGEDDRVVRSYPHELSGGMKQRAMIAMALSCNPRLLIADEPTTGLDVTVQNRILRLLTVLNKRMGMAILLISHDLAVVRHISDKISVIYGGRVVESGHREPVFNDPQHPYTKLLLASIPDANHRGARLAVISGDTPDPERLPKGCTFHPRCPFSEELCSAEVPISRPSAPKHRVECHLVGRRPLELSGEAHQ